MSVSLQSLCETTLLFALERLRGVWISTQSPGMLGVLAHGPGRGAAAIENVGFGV